MNLSDLRYLDLTKIPKTYYFNTTTNIVMGILFLQAVLIGGNGNCPGVTEDSIIIDINRYGEAIPEMLIFLIIGGLGARDMITQQIEQSKKTNTQEKRHYE